MTKSSKIKKRPYPYYKVQAWDPLKLTWQDHRKEAFSDEATARAYLSALDPALKARIVRWDERGSIPLGERE